MHVVVNHDLGLQHATSDAEAMFDCPIGQTVFLLAPKKV